MSLLRRPTTDARPTAAPLEREPRDTGLSPVGLAELRDQVDPDPLVEQATDRLRTALTSLDARDEWGRQLAWRQIARIAIGPLLTELRDSQTAARLTEATAQVGAQPTPPLVELELFAEPRGAEDGPELTGNGWPTRPTM